MKSRAWRRWQLLSTDFLIDFDYLGQFSRFWLRPAGREELVDVVPREVWSLSTHHTRRFVCRSSALRVLLRGRLKKGLRLVSGICFVFCEREVISLPCYQGEESSWPSIVFFVQDVARFSLWRSSGTWSFWLSLAWLSVFEWLNRHLPGGLDSSAEETSLPRPLLRPGTTSVSFLSYF